MSELAPIQMLSRLSIEPASVRDEDHLDYFAKALGHAATLRPMNPTEPWRVLSDFDMFRINEGQVVFCHLSPFEYHRPAMDTLGQSGGQEAVAITVCFDGELLFTYNRDHVVKAKPGQIVVAQPSLDTRAIAAQPTRYLTLYLNNSTMLSATGLSPASPAIQAAVPEGIWPVLSTLANQLRDSLRNGDGASLGPLLKAFEVLIDQLVRPQFLSMAQVSEDRILAIQAFVDENIRNPALGVKLLCERFHVSRATLYRQMQPLGGVKHYLQSRRLVRCFDEMRKSPSLDDGFLKVLVKSYNFKSIKDFAERYQRHFGAHPIEMLSQGGTAVAGNNATVMFSAPAD